MYRMTPGLLVAFFAALAVSCSGAQKTKTSEKPAEETAKKPVESTQEEAPTKTSKKTEVHDQGDGIPWKDKTHEQRKAYMKMTVKPTMKRLFTGFDAERFDDFGCTTCHGKSAMDGNFDMPNPELPKLTDFEKLKKEKPETMKFMKTTVVPTMARLLDQQPYDPKTKKGFGCMECHTR